MLYTTPKMKKLYGEIQKRLFYMIPEKWDKIYLFASIEEGMNKLETGEMYFYYFPKGILKKDPVNVYEIPGKFNIEELQYYRLADGLYGVIKRLRKEFISANNKVWTNIIISVENFKFKVEYGFENLKDSPYNSYDRHIIFRYLYLNTSINTYNKKERRIIENFIRDAETRPPKRKATYIEPVYKIEQNNVIEYQRENEEALFKTSRLDENKDDKPVNFNYEMENDYEKNAKKPNKIISKIKHEKKAEEYVKQEDNEPQKPKTQETKKLKAKHKKKYANTEEEIEEKVKEQVEQTIQETKSGYKNQILNFDKWD